MAEKEPEIKILTTERPEGPEDKSTLKTPSGEANVEIVTMTWYSQVGIRCLRSYVQNVLGYLLGAGLGVGVAQAAEAIAAEAGVSVPADTAALLKIVMAALFAGIGPTIICFLQNSYEILTKLDVTAPRWRA